MARCKTGMSVQSYIFPTTKWTRSSARSWLKKYDQKRPAADETQDYLRYRQSIPAQFKKGSFRTITIDQKTGIKAVVGCPRNTNKRRNPVPTILAMNPRGKKRRKPAKRRTTKKRTPRKVVTTMAKRKRGRRKSTTRRRRRRNPSPARRGGRARSYARSTIGGVNFTGAFKNAIPLVFGALLSKFAAKRFAEGGGEMEEWNWKNYMLALAGGMVGAIATATLIKARGNIAQKIFEGSMLLVLYKIFTGEIAPKNATLSAWFSGYGELPGNEYGQIWAGNETDYMTGADGLYRPIDEGHRYPGAAGYGQIVPATPTMGHFGDEIVAAGPTMGQDVDMSPSASVISDEFQKAYA